MSSPQSCAAADPSTYYDGPFIFVTEQWCNKRSNKAVVSTGSWKISAHFEKELFIVIIVEDFSRDRKRFY